MSKLEQGSEEYRVIKEEINKEGMEIGEEGGAAVNIGNKKEVEAARERAEAEGRAPDLESYIRLNKQVVAPQSELFEFLTEEEKEQFKSLPPGAMQISSVIDNHIRYYKDSQGNLAKIILYINELQTILKVGTNYEDIRKAADKALQKMGFKEEFLFGKEYNNHRPPDVEELIKKKRAEKLKTETQKGFSF